MSGPYDDIIDLPHPTSTRHPRMPMANRAAQFSPFAALTGYEDAVQETARQTVARPELTEEEKSHLNAELQALAEKIGEHPTVSLTYFQPDERKAGGAFVTAEGAAKKLDRHTGMVILDDGRKIPVENLMSIQLI